MGVPIVTGSPKFYDNGSSYPKPITACSGSLAHVQLPPTAYTRVTAEVQVPD